MDHQSRARLIDLTVLIAIMLVGFALRAHRLDGQDLWGDEAASLSIVLDTWGEVFSPARETHPPLHRVLYKPWVDAVGQKPLFALRYAPMLAGMLLVPLTVHLGRQLFGRRVGMLAALLVAVGPLHVYYAQEFRTYSLFTVLAVGTVSAFVVLTRRGAHCKRAWAVYLAVTLAAIYTHYLAFWLIVAQNAVALLSGAWAGRRWRWLGGQALLALSYLPWIMAQAPFLLGQGGRRALTWTVTDAWEIVRRGALSWTVGLTPGDSMALAAALTLGAVALAGVGLAVAASPPERWRAGLLGGCVGFTLLMGWAVNPAMPFFHERFLIGAAPVFTVLVVAGVARFKAGWHVMLLAVVVLGALAADHQWYTNPAYQKSGYGGAMRAVAARAMPGDCILLSNGHQMALFDYYRPPGIEAALTDPAALADPERVDPHLQGLVGDAERVWLIEYGDPIGYDRQRRAPAWLAERGFRQSFFSFLGGRSRPALATLSG
jgi:mannosyltransferase